eukprot:GILJ01002572.1.p1 GENE.GILJ01002572.1~~GILJ01002572.1.p1  ORF type:complete len:191 (+),score=12.52 GILJ01002572.1:39-575(+)
MLRRSSALLSPPQTFLREVSNIGQDQIPWHVYDGKGQVLGRFATHIARVLMGKHKPTYRPNVLCSDHVVVINCDKITLTGRKWDQKIYYRYSGYPGGLKETTAKTLRERHPDMLIKEAVRRMLPKNNLATYMLKRLHLHTEAQHPYKDVAQLPELIETADYSVVFDTNPSWGPAPAAK